MAEQAIVTQLTFHYVDGRNESFTLYEAIQAPSAQSTTAQDGEWDPFNHQIRHILGKDWWVLHLPEKSILINMDTVVKVEINPPLSPERDDITATVEGVREKLLNAIQDIE